MAFVHVAMVANDDEEKNAFFDMLIFIGLIRYYPSQKIPDCLIDGREKPLKLKRGQQIRECNFLIEAT